MNEWQVQKAIRAQLAGFPNKLSMWEKKIVTYTHPVTGQPFCEVAAEYFSALVRLNPFAMPRVRRAAMYYSGLAKQLLTYFPDDRDLQAIANGWDTPPRPRDDYNYSRDVVRRRRRPSYFPRIVADAELVAAYAALREAPWNKNAEWHLREERIHTLVSLLCLFSSPEATAASPVETKGKRREGS